MGRKKNKGTKPTAKSSGGSMTGMRSGFKSAVGQGKKKAKKSSMDFMDILTIGMVLAVVIIAIWQFTR